MFTASETTATILIVLLAVGVLSWGFYRAKPFGKIGILAWLQSVVLMAPWLLFFTLFAAGIYLNLVSIIFLLVTSAGVYIFLGNKLRAASKDLPPLTRLTQMNSTSNQVPQAQDNLSAGEETAKLEVIPPPISNEDLKTIQGIFGIDTFFVTETVPYQEGAIFKGNLRGGIEQVYSRLSSSLQTKFGDRYRLFLVENPEGKPTVVVLPSSNDPQPSTLSQKIFAVILLVLSLATGLETAGLLLNFDFFATPERWREALPIAVGVWMTLAVHEIGHRILAKRHQIRLSWPFFIPSWQISSFGAITRFESLLPNRAVLFDISLAGPAAGGILSLIMLSAGFALSHQGSQFQIPSQFFQGSILVGTLAKVILGSRLEASVVDVHPLVVIGWLGLVITALNLLPAGQLDGGRIVHAIYGRKIAQNTTIGTLMVLAVVSFINPANSITLYWAIVILFLQRNLERPSLNEITEPNDARAALALLALFLMIATLIPLSPALAGSLGIGG
ncbi:site-2 protease family protein [Merismopedia glauca]|uniref:Site-2 protease family protein n=1 Tax=Merismopedia glauca CCAP 1448/3 TaxID=1296344 RepID=A0A2T1C0T9_9CYAN|nr:site-2 protease family protein [Merismopedia glauca]PSB01788.1 site-2 protease family protein [Merismopedia glauca CCAP 1448/3]